MKFKTILSFVIIAGVFCIILVGITNLIGDVRNTKINKDLNKDCVWQSNPTSNRNIILRVDDIQAYAWEDIQTRMIKDSLKKNYPLVLGIIPKNFKEDKWVYNLVKKNRCKVEVALHGYDHTHEEFLWLSEGEARVKIKDGLEELNGLGEIVTFIPPNNKISSNLIPILEENNIEFISGAYKSVYGFDVSSFDWSKGSIAEVDDMFNECKKSLDEKGMCIIMFHPQDYADEYGNLDEEKYKYYIELLDRLPELNGSVITFKDL